MDTLLRFSAFLLLSILSLALPGKAGTATISTTATSVSLASDPYPGNGKTQLNVRFSSWTYNARWGFENLDSSAHYQPTIGQAYLQVLLPNNGANVLTDFINSPHQHIYGAYDGVTDDMGTSGQSINENLTQTSNWASVLAQPSTLDVNRTFYAGPWYGGMYHSHDNSVCSGTLEWYWSVPGS